MDFSDTHLFPPVWGAGLLVFLFLAATLMRRGCRTCQDQQQSHIQALQAQIAAKSQLAAIVEASDDGIVGRDSQGIITSWNAGAERLLGYRAGEVIGRQEVLLFPEERQNEVARLLAGIWRGGHVRNFETVMLRKDGQPVTVSLTVSPILDGAGRIVGTSKIIRDITEQKQAEERIKQLNRELQSRVDELQTVMDVVPVAIAIADDRECRKIRMNRAGQAMLLLAPGINASKSGDERDCLPFKVLRDGRELAAEELPMQYAARHATPVREFEAEILRDDGKRLTFYEYASPLFDEAGLVRGCVGVFVDITERKRAEEALRDADRRKDEFIAMLAHELRNPLAPILNALQVMKALGPKEPRLVWSCEVIDRQVAHMARLLDDLLDVARVMQGKVALKTERVALAEVIDRALESSLPLIEARRQDIAVKLPDAVCWLEGDPVRLAQVLSNLLNNAAKYTGEGGHVTLTAGHEGEEAVIRVADNGIGMSPELLSSMFDLFAQADHSLAHAQGGLGLGLPLARQLAEMHGGTLTGTSAGLGHGSEFTLRLPLSEGPSVPEALAAPPAASPDTAKPRILVVDDYVDMAETLAVWLRLAGYEVRSADTGAKALECAARFQPQAVLLDIGLPDMDGYEVARRLRQSPSTRGVALIALTGYGQGEDLQRSSAAGFDCHLLKPVSPEQLADLLASFSAERKTVG